MSFRTRAWVLGALCAAVLSACNILGPALYLAHGPPKIPKAYELDDERATLVLVENGRGLNLSERTLRQIANAATESMLAERVVKTAIDPQAGYIAAADDVGGRKSPIVEIGRKAEAEVVVYVTVDSFTLSQDGYSVQPIAIMSARVFDAVSANEDGSRGRRIWPGDEEPAHSFTVETVQLAGVTPRDASEIRRAESDLAQRAGEGVAKLFYDSDQETARDRRLE